jgi:dephospho-CoA kinase
VLLVGLTGGIASGKSLVSRRFAEVHGFPVVDADLVAREVVEPGQPALAEVAGRWPDVIGPDGRIDRPALAAIVFADDGERAALNAITHPRIAEAMGRRIAALADHDGPVVVDSPLLLEMGHAAAYPVIVVVAAEPDVQHRRLVELRGMDPDEAWGRIRSQAPLADKLAIATHVIRNDGTVTDLEARTDEVAAALRTRARDG